MPDLYAPYVVPQDDNRYELRLRVEGMHCAGCATRIAETLNTERDVRALVDLATSRLTLSWADDPFRAEKLIHKVSALGYRFFPEGDPSAEDAAKRESRFLTDSAIISLIGLGATLPLMHADPGVAAFVASAATLVSGMPFYLSAARALKGRSTNMDQPISAALLLTLGLGLFDFWMTGASVAFDSGLMLIFILLLGRILDLKTRNRAKSAAEGLLRFLNGAATLVEGDSTREIPIRLLRADQILLVAPGEKIPADGIVIEGTSEADPSFITGETATELLAPGTQVFGGMINLIAPVKIKTTQTGGASLPGEVLKLLEKAQQTHARAVRIADKAAKIYTPFVFTVALAGFAGWMIAGAAWPIALRIATSVLVITCPCALGLAVPAVQVVASTLLFRHGLLLKSGDALERLASVDTVVFDKTGTLTEGRPRLTNKAEIPPKLLARAAMLASGSHHPLAKALKAASGLSLAPPEGLTEKPGLGMEVVQGGQVLRLGRRSWCGDPAAPATANPELWFNDGTKATRFTFEDALRQDTPEALQALREAGCRLILLSGDRPEVVETVAERLGIATRRGACTPLDKAAFLEDLKAKGAKILMVGDGLNDAAALALADASISPSTALDIAQNAASIVFQGHRLMAVPFALKVARKAQRLVKENFALAMLYNLIAVPVALMGLATPMLAAAAMAASSLTVVLNAQRGRNVR